MKLQWTHERPTEPGWYVIRSRGALYELLFLRRHASGFSVCWEPDAVSWGGLSVYSPSTLFCGPLEIAEPEAENTP